jgi:hypothetical protein
MMQDPVNPHNGTIVALSMNFFVIVFTPAVICTKFFITSSQHGFAAMNAGFSVFHILLLA